MVTLMQRQNYTILKGRGSDIGRRNAVHDQRKAFRFCYVKGRMCRVSKAGVLYILY